MNLIDLVRRRITQRIAEMPGMTPRKLSLKVSNNPELVRGVLRADGKGNPEFDTLVAIARGLERSVAWLVADEGELDGTAVTGPTVPVLTTAHGALVAGEVSGTRIGQQLQRVPRPPNPALAHADLYAVFIAGDSMLPDHPEGALRFVQRGRPALPGDTVIVHTRNWAEDPGQAYIKRLRGGRSGKLVLEQLNPSASIAIPEQYVTAVDRVLSFNELFGI